MTTDVSTADGKTLSVNFSFATTGTAPELSNDAGETYYKVGDQYLKHASNHAVGTMTVSAAFSASDATVWAASNADDAVYYVDLTASSPVVLLESGATTAIYKSGDQENDDVVTSVLIKFTIAAADGSITINQTYGANGSTVKYAVRSAGNSLEEQATVEAAIHDGKLDVSAVRTTAAA